MQIQRRQFEGCKNSKATELKTAKKKKKSGKKVDNKKFKNVTIFEGCKIKNCEFQRYELKGYKKFEINAVEGSENSGMQ